MDISKFTPVKQAIVLLLLPIIIVLLMGAMGNKGETAWTTACCSLLFYAIINAVVGFTSKKTMPYVLVSMGLFIVAALSFIFLGKFGIIDIIGTHYSHLMLFGTIVVFYIIANVVSTLLKTIYKLTKES